MKKKNNIIMLVFLMLFISKSFVLAAVDTGSSSVSLNSGSSSTSDWVYGYGDSGEQPIDTVTNITYDEETGTVTRTYVSSDGETYEEIESAGDYDITTTTGENGEEVMYIYNSDGTVTRVSSTGGTLSTNENVLVNSQTTIVSSYSGNSSEYFNGTITVYYDGEFSQT